MSKISLCRSGLSVAMGLFANATIASDSFSAATALTGATASSSESSQNATTETGEPQYSGTAYRSLWWKWTAPAHGRATVSTLGSSELATGSSSTLGKYMGVYIAKNASPSVSSLAQVGWDGNSSNAFPEGSFPVAAGTTYYIQVCSTSSSEYGTIKVNIALDSATDINQLALQGLGLYSNDFFANRASLTGLRASSIAYNSSATNEPSGNEPDFGYRTMWWTWTAPDHGRLTVSTTGSDEENWGKRMAIFSGTELASLRWLASAGGAANTLPSIDIPVSRGQVYQIGLGSNSSTEFGAFVLSLNLRTNTDINALNIVAAASAENDLFANRVTLPAVAQASSIGYGTFATNEALEPALAGNGTLWWTYTAPASGTVSLSTTGTLNTNGKYLSVWTGGSPGTLTQVARVGGAAVDTPSLSFAATASQTYQIAVGASGSGSTPGDVVLSLSGPPGPTDAGLTTLTIDRAVRLRWPTMLGASYRIQSSNDLHVWSNDGAVIVGDGGVREALMAVTSAKLFFRVIKL